CSRLAPKDKIQNAQNMAFFALEVMANPESGAPPGGSCTIMKRDNPDMLLGGTEDLMARSGYSPRDEYEAFLRRQAGPASTLSSMRRNATSSRPPTRSTSRRPTATPCSSKAPLPAIPTGGGTPGDRDGFPQAVYDNLKKKAAPTTAPPATSTVPPPPPPTSSDSSILETAGPLPSATAAPVQPVACYNFNVNAYGYCCRGPDSPCEKDLGTCYYGGTGVTGGATNVVPDGATCPPPADAKS
ncbi:hypothetical protein K4K55_003069, partial [Colletotrichum sp. SAR 10_96]